MKQKSNKTIYIQTSIADALRYLSVYFPTHITGEQIGGTGNQKNDFLRQYVVFFTTGAIFCIIKVMVQNEDKKT